MNRKLLISVLAVYFIIIGSINCIWAYTELSPKSSITGQGTIPFTPGPILDDFNYGTSVNKWGAITGAFGSASPDPTGSCAASYVAASGTGSNGNCLKLEYNVTTAGSYAGYYSQLGGISFSSPLPGTSLTPTAISFYVKGTAGNTGQPFFKIQLKNAATQALIYITDYLDGGVTNTWQKVTIPFHNFVNLGNVGSWGNMVEFAIVFENSQSVTNGNPTSGIIYIDDITFETTPITVVRVDHFGDKLGICALGGNMGTGVADGAPATLNKYSFSNVTNEYSPYANGLKLEYNVTAGYAYTFIIFGGGGTGWVATAHNFSAYNVLSIKVRARSSAENPETIKLEIVDSAGAKSGLITLITTSWQTYNISLSAFSGLDKTTIKQITFVFENSRAADKTGVIFIDSVEFRQM